MCASVFRKMRPINDGLCPASPSLPLHLIRSLILLINASATSRPFAGGKLLARARR